MTSSNSDVTKHEPNGDLERNQHQDDASPDTTRHGGTPRSHFSVLVEDFSFVWFTISMNTGILSILMHQNPYQFSGLYILSTIMFVFNICQFAAFFGILCLRVLWFPGKIMEVATTNLFECAMMGAVPIAFSTIVGQVALTVSNASWGGRAFMIVAYVLWWLNTAVMMAVGVAVFVLVSKFHVTKAAQMTPVMVIPFVGTVTDAVVGGLVVNYAHGMTPGLAVPVIVVSYMLTGIGFLVGLIIFAVYFARLLDTGLPPGAQSPSLFLLVGPPGQTAAALLLLGTASSTYFPDYMRGTTLTQTGGTIFDMIGVMWALMFLGLAVFFEFVCLFLTLEAAWKKQHKYSLLWWSTIFPNATVNTAWISLSQSLDSTAFKVLATMYLLILVTLYIVNAVFTVWYISTGWLMNGKRSDAPYTERIKEQ